MRLPQLLALATLVAGVAATVWAATELQGGIVELPSHWWSTAAAFLLVLGGTASLAAWRLERSA